METEKRIAQKKLELKAAWTAYQAAEGSAGDALELLRKARAAANTSPSQATVGLVSTARATYEELNADAARKGVRLDKISAELAALQENQQS